MFFFLVAPSGPPQNLQVFNETTTSLTAQWEHAPGRVQNYRITYMPVAGGRPQSVRVIWTRFGVWLMSLNKDSQSKPAGGLHSMFS